MTDILKPGAGILFMKVGIHARESLDDIIARKSKEIEDTGYAMWGYGGNTCHPRTMVRPFTDAFANKGPIFLCMQEIRSNHSAEPLRARESSVDGLNWEPIPKSINVNGSKFALVIKGLRRQDLVLPLERTKVAVGQNRGRVGSRYVRGRVDKACLEIGVEPERTNVEDKKLIPINLVAELASPFAVFLRNDR